LAVSLPFSSHLILRNLQNPIEWTRLKQALHLNQQGFLMFGFVLMLIATLPMLQIGGFSSAKELVAGVGIFTFSAFIFNMGLVLKVWSTFDGADHEPKNAIRPLIPLIAVIIYFVTS
jgi:hypothetical protein